MGKIYKNVQGPTPAGPFTMTSSPAMVSPVMPQSNNGGWPTPAGPFTMTSSVTPTDATPQPTTMKRCFVGGPMEGVVEDNLARFRAHVRVLGTAYLICEDGSFYRRTTLHAFVTGESVDEYHYVSDPEERFKILAALDQTEVYQAQNLESFFQHYPSASHPAPTIRGRGPSSLNFPRTFWDDNGKKVP